MQKINPCLWFDNQAELAAQFYTSVFEKSKIYKTAYYTESGSKISGQKKDSVMTVEFELEGLKFIGLNGGPHFKFTPAVSFFVYCKNETEIEKIWKKLSAHGNVLWDLKQYPWAEKYGWCEDQFGVSWQLIIGESKQKIAPAFLYMDNLFGKGDEAIKFYTQTFKNSQIENIHQDPHSNSVMHATFILESQKFVLMEGRAEKHHEINMAISFIVNCQTQDEVDYYWETLSRNGTKERCGWLKDQFGVSWQIVPLSLSKMMSDSNHKKTEKVMSAMLQMKKIDIESLEKAYNQ